MLPDLSLFLGAIVTAALGCAYLHFLGHGDIVLGFLLLLPLIFRVRFLKHNLTAAQLFTAISKLDQTDNAAA